MLPQEIGRIRILVESSDEGKYSGSSLILKAIIEGAGPVTMYFNIIDPNDRIPKGADGILQVFKLQTSDPEQWTFELEGTCNGGSGYLNVDLPGLENGRTYRLHIAHTISDSDPMKRALGQRTPIGFFDGSNRPTSPTSKYSFQPVDNFGEAWNIILPQ